MYIIACFGLGFVSIGKDHICLKKLFNLMVKIVARYKGLMRHPQENVF